jgi:hypothetical protein
MVKRLIFWCVLFAIWIALVAFLMDCISGGPQTAKDVMLATKAHNAVTGYYGEVLEIQQDSGRSRASLGADGVRNGSFSFFVRGTGHAGTVRVEWVQEGTNVAEITGIWRIDASEKENVLWQRP